MTDIKKVKRVFLGGTCNNSTWREFLIPDLEIDYFNPVVKDWKPEDQEAEKEQRKTADYCLYVITPLMVGTYSIAEAVDDSNKRPEKTIFYYNKTDIKEITRDGLTFHDIVEFNAHQIKSLEQVGRLIEANGGTWCKEYEDLIHKLNS